MNRLQKEIASLRISAIRILNQMTVGKALEGCYEVSKRKADIKQVKIN